MVDTEIINTYRRERISDLLLDYVDDENLDSRHVYEELLAEVKSLSDYFLKKHKKMENLYTLMLGHREVDLSELKDLL
jgi:hypothetical protein